MCANDDTHHDLMTLLNSVLPESPATPEAIAALRAHPRFSDAMRTSASGLVDLYQGGRLLNWLMDDRGRLLFGYLALYLHFTRDPADPASGLTPTRMKAHCAELDICSPGRATAMLSLMRFAGYLAPAPATDRRVRGLVATDRLIGLLAERWRLHFTAMAPLLPEGEAALAVLDDQTFARAFTGAMVARFSFGFRFLKHVPDLGLFADRNAGMLILASLLSAGEVDDTVPPTRPVRVSISALARRFAVSRPHVLKLMRDAAEQRFIERVGPAGGSILILPRLSAAAENLFATMYLFLADCAREATEQT
ncbi:MAG: hypothetical protein C0522_13940, partial [Rhodocyclaceae bacterium]|nr:hypothetical protein [Rhodocyclaceae bacterium]